MGGVGQTLVWVTWVTWVCKILAWVEWVHKNLAWVKKKAWVVWVEILTCVAWVHKIGVGSVVGWMVWVHRIFFKFLLFSMYCNCS